MWRSMLEPWGCTPQVTRGMVCVLFVCSTCVCVGCELQYVCDCVEHFLRCVKCLKCVETDHHLCVEGIV